MRIPKRFGFLASITILATMVLTPRATISAQNGPAFSRIPFAKHTIDANCDGANSVYATDLDGDEDVDVLGAAGDDIIWWENDGNENFAKHTIDGNYDGAHVVYAINMDGDADVDVVGAAFYADEITWWENDGSENFTRHVIDGAFDLAIAVYAIDLDDDGDVDVLGAARAANDITWWENDGSENFTEHTIDGNFEGAHAVYATDLDGDGDVDVLGGAWLAYDVAWWENDGSENFTEHTIDGDFAGVQSVYATDVDGDEDVDVLGAAYSGDEIAWWENDGDESFAKHTIVDNFNGVKSVYAADVDNDQDVDILGAGSYADEITWWENNGSESFTEHTIADHLDGASAVYAADVDGDGDVDVLSAASGDADEVAWWEQGRPLMAVYLPSALKSVGPPASAPVLDDISNPDGDGSYAVNWSAVAGATSYVLQEDDNAGFSSPAWVYFGSNTSTSITDSAVGTYYYRVMARNVLGSSEWSAVKSVDVTVEPTPQPCPDSGAWSGETNQGWPIDFAVSSNCRVGDLTIEYVLTCPGSLLWKTKTFDTSTSISDDRFAFDADGDPTVSGRFTSQTRATGTWESSLDLPGVGTCSGSGTWSADGP